MPKTKMAFSEINLIMLFNVKSLRRGTISRNYFTEARYSSTNGEIILGKLPFEIGIDLLE